MIAAPKIKQELTAQKQPAVVKNMHTPPFTVLKKLLPPPKEPVYPEGMMPKQPEQYIKAPRYEYF